MAATRWDELLNNFLPSFRRAPSLTLEARRQAWLFYHAVNWSEPFFKYLGVFHVNMLVISIIATWGNASPERILCMVAVLLFFSFLAFPINSYGSAHAEEIFFEPGVNYFDENGLFIAVVYWLPLVLMAGVQIMRLFLRLLEMMVEVKKKQLQAEQRQLARARRAEAAKEAAAATTEGTEGPTVAAAEVAKEGSKAENTEPQSAEKSEGEGKKKGKAKKAKEEDKEKKVQ